MSSKSIILVLLLGVVVLMGKACYAAEGFLPTLMKKWCSDDLGNEAFRKNRHSLLITLEAFLPHNSMYTVMAYPPLIDAPDTAYGVGQCRQDISFYECIGCIALAATDLESDCMNRTEGKVWYDVCFVQYSNRLIFGEVDNKFDFCTLNSTVPKDIPGLVSKTRDLFLDLQWKALEVKWPPQDFYASGSIKWGQRTIYGHIQCNMDLSGDNCLNCFKNQIAQIPSCCAAREGCTIYGASCMLRYDLYDFLWKNHTPPY